MKEIDRYGSGSVMVWVGITAADRTELVSFETNVYAVVNLDKVLIPNVVSFFKKKTLRYSVVPKRQ